MGRGVSGRKSLGGGGGGGSRQVYNIDTRTGQITTGNASGGGGGGSTRTERNTGGGGGANTQSNNAKENARTNTAKKSTTTQSTKRYTQKELASKSRSQLVKIAQQIYVRLGGHAGLSESEALKRFNMLIKGNSTTELRKYISRNQGR